MSESSYENIYQELASRAADIRPSDVVLFPEPLRSAVNFVVRLGNFNLTEFSKKLGFTRQQAKAIADLLTKRNLFTLQPADPANPAEVFYEARLSAPARSVARKSIDIWKKLD